jgi:hypothetical protein
MLFLELTSAISDLKKATISFSKISSIGDFIFDTLEGDSSKI